mmetsp:Transcript_30287/g.66265  ORF Transcript_30287/g.66265 Transcript_30287/m.66265 type:complete len:90 (-) Transcript_30287:128-397(-)
MEVPWSSTGRLRSMNPGSLLEQLGQAVGPVEVVGEFEGGDHGWWQQHSQPRILPGEEGVMSGVAQLGRAQTAISASACSPCILVAWQSH